MLVPQTDHRLILGFREMFARISGDTWCKNDSRKRSGIRKGNEGLGTALRNVIANTVALRLATFELDVNGSSIHFLGR